MEPVRNGFREGAKGYAPAVMWFLSGNIDLREMTRQLEGFKEQGIEDFFIHPVDHSQGDYLGEHFFRIIRHAVKEAERLGLHYWIYDEYNWPSGVAGGQVLRDAPWARMSCLCRYSIDAAPGETVRLALPPQAENNTVPLLFACGREEVPVRLFGDTAEWTNDSSEPRTLDAYVSKWMRQLHYNTLGSDVAFPEEGYLDTMDPEAVNVFIQKTHEVYKREIGHAFGTTVRGVFTDEVPLSYVEKQPEDFVGRLMPWTRRMLEKFREINGYDLRPKLPLLFTREDPLLMIDYWRTVTSLFMSAYMDQTSGWCEKNGLIYTGHLLYEEEINKDIVYSGDPYEYYRRFTWPGVDTICSFYRINDYSFNITAKLGSSARRFAGKERLMCETYTISGWFIRLRDMKRIFNRLALLGVNFIQYMGAQYDLELAYQGTSMTNNWQNPLFRHYDRMTQYISGVQHLTATSEYRARALVYYPLTAARTLVSTRPPFCTTTVEMDRTLQGLVNALLVLNVPFEFGYEQVLEAAEVSGGEIVIAGSRYDVVILPCAAYLTEKTYAQLEAFARGGGRVVAVNGDPRFIVGSGTLRPAGPLPAMRSYTCHDYDLLSDPTRYDTEKASLMGRFAAALRQALEGLPERVYSLEPVDGVLSGLFEHGTGFYVMIVNDNPHPAEVRGHVAGDTPFRALCADGGAEKPLATDGRRFTLALDAFECVFIEIAPDAVPSLPQARPQEKAEIGVSAVRFTPARDNAFLPVVHQVHGQTRDEILSAVRVNNPRRILRAAQNAPDTDLVLCRSLFNKRNPLEGAPDWYGWYPSDKTFAKAGESVVCFYDFELDSMPDVMDLIGEANTDVRWYLNGERLFQTGTRRVWHYANPVFDLTGTAQQGTNRLVGICTMPDVELDYAMPAAVIRGDFRVWPDLKITTRPGGNALDYWNGQGYYFYTGDGVYTAEFTAAEADRVFLELTTTDVAEVFVNGRSAGRLLWDPYRLPLTGLLKDGVNRLEIRITSTGANLIHGQTPSGLGALRLYLER